MIKFNNVSFCIPIVASDLDELREELAKTKDVNLIELRRDYLEPDVDDELIKEELSKLSKDTEVIFTYRSYDEGGQSDIKNQVRFETIGKYLDSNITYLDIEEKHLEEFLKEFNELPDGIQLIVSYHNFQKTPNREKIFSQLEKNSKHANIVKVAYKVNSLSDITSLAWASREFRKNYPGIPLIIIGMGELGVATRVFPELIGSNLSFAPVSSNSSAPGQVNLNCLEDIRVSVNEKEKTRIFNWSNGLW